MDPEPVGQHRRTGARRFLTGVTSLGLGVALVAAVFYGVQRLPQAESRTPAAPLAPRDLRSWPLASGVLVEWDPPVLTPGGRVTEYEVQVVGNGDGLPVRMTISGEHTSVLIPAAPGRQASGGLDICVAARSSRGPKTSQCTYDIRPADAPEQSAPCTESLGLDELLAAFDREEAMNPFPLFDRLDIDRWVTEVEIYFGARLGGIWGDPAVTPSFFCIGAVGLTSRDVDHVRSLIVGPVDRVEFRSFKYSLRELEQFADQAVVALMESPTPCWSVDAEESRNLVEVGTSLPELPAEDRRQILRRVPSDAVSFEGGMECMSQK